jgi:carbon storage regulator CsrA
MAQAVQRFSTLTNNYKREGFAMSDGFLLLTRRTGEEIEVTLEDGRKIIFAIFGVRRGQVRIGINAAKTITVDRMEIADRKRRERGDVDGNR